MNKQELVKAVAEKTDRPIKDVVPVLDTILETIEDTVSEGDRVILVNFGTFSSKNRKERTGVVPGTRNKITIPAKKVPHFKPGNRFKEAMK